MNEPAPSVSREQFLDEVARPAEGALQRRPADGWIPADPFPMGASTRAALRAVIDALLPPPPAPRPADIIDRVEAHVRFTLPYMPRPNALGAVLLIHLLDLSPLWTFAAPRRLRSLGRARASAILAGLTDSRLMALRQLMLAVKGLILPAYFDQDEVHVALGYAPVPFMAERTAFRRRLVAGEAPRPEDRMGPYSKEVAP